MFPFAVPGSSSSRTLYPSRWLLKKPPARSRRPLLLSAKSHAALRLLAYKCARYGSACYQLFADTWLCAGAHCGSPTAAPLQAVQTAAASLELIYPDADWGNVSGDGAITSADALVALQGAAGKVELTGEQRAAANVDGKGGVTANDALMILQYATQKIASFPVEMLDVRR